MDRTQLIQAVFVYLKSMGIAAELSQQRRLSRKGMGIIEPVINLIGSNVSRISLHQLVETSCSEAGNTARFHFLVDCVKNFPENLVYGTWAETRTSPEGLKWIGQELGDILNQDKDISQSLLECGKSTRNIDFQIEAASSHEVYIIGARFTNPRKFAPLFLAAHPGDVDLDCIFGFKIAEKIAGHIKSSMA